MGARVTGLQRRGGRVAMARMAEMKMRRTKRKKRMKVVRTTKRQKRMMEVSAFLESHLYGCVGLEKSEWTSFRLEILSWWHQVSFLVLLDLGISTVMPKPHSCRLPLKVMKMKIQGNWK